MSLFQIVWRSSWPWLTGLLSSVTPAGGRCRDESSAICYTPDAQNEDSLRGEFGWSPGIDTAVPLILSSPQLASSAHTAPLAVSEPIYRNIHQPPPYRLSS